MSWIKLHSELLNHEVFSDPRKGFAWVYLLLSTAWEDRWETHNGIAVEVKRGSVAASVRELAQAWRVSRSWAQDFKEWLEKRTMIRTLNYKNKLSLIEIVNWDTWQTKQDTKADTERTLSGHSSIRKKNLRILDKEKHIPRARASLGEVEDYACLVGLPRSDGAYLFHKWEGNGWTNDGKPIIRWKSVLQSHRIAGYLPSLKSGNGSGKKTDGLKSLEEIHERHRQK